MKGHARSLMTPHATTVNEDAPLREVASTLITAGFGGVPVVNKSGALVGFLSQLDVAQALLDGKLDGNTVADVMTKSVVSIDEFATTDEVIRLFRAHKIHHLPVVREGAVVGIITPTDVIRHFVKTGEDVA